MCGLTTLRITSSPSTVVAAWICPMDALPSGFGSMEVNISSMGRPSPFATRSLYSGNGITGSRSSRFFSSSVMNGGSRSSLSASTWPSLMYVGPRSSSRRRNCCSMGSPRMSRRTNGLTKNAATLIRKSGKPFTQANWSRSRATATAVP